MRAIDDGTLKRVVSWFGNERPAEYAIVILANPIYCDLSAKAPSKFASDAAFSAWLMQRTCSKCLHVCGCTKCRLRLEDGPERSG